MNHLLTRAVAVVSKAILRKEPGLVATNPHLGRSVFASLTHSKPDLSFT